MKNPRKALILTNLVWVVLVLVFTLKSCSVDSMQAASSKDGDVVMNYIDRDFNSLPLGAALTLVKNYKDKDSPVNQLDRKEPGKKLEYKLKDGEDQVEDARSVWFSLEELENFMWIIKYYTENGKINVSAKDLGVRVYYGRYPDTNTLKSNIDFKDINPGYANLHTVFMVPTFKDQGKDIDFDPFTSFRNGKLTPLSSDFGTDFLKVDYTSPAILNHGNLCPPCWDEN